MLNPMEGFGHAGSLMLNLHFVEFSEKSHHFQNPPPILAAGVF